MANYLNAEQHIAEVLRNSEIIFNGEKRKVIIAEKPSYFSGEGKTDIYCLLDNGEEIKISYKKNNADFLENKLSASRAKEIFGNDAEKILINSIKPLIPLFNQSQIYFPQKVGRIAAGSYTMGWRCDLIKRKSTKGKTLTTPVVLTNEQVKEILSGMNLEESKKNAKVNNKIVENSGVANYFLNESNNENSAQDIINNLIPIEKCNMDIDITFRRVNYRSLEDKIDGNRPLAVYVDWKTHNLIFDKPLKYCAKNDILKIFKENRT